MRRLGAFAFIASAVLYQWQPWAPEIVGMPLQVPLLWISVVVLWRTDGIRLFPLERGVYALLVFPFILYFWILYDVNTGQEWLRIIQLATGLLLCSVAFQWVLVNSNYLWKLISALLFAGVCHAVYAFGQYIGVLGWGRTVYSGSAGGAVPTGLENSPVTLSYSLVPIIGISLTRYFNASGRSKVLWVIISIVLVLAILSSQSRSGFAAVVLMYIILQFLFFDISTNENLKRMFYKFTVFLFVLVAIAPLAVDLPAGRWEGVSEDSRLGGTMLAFGPILLESPLGVGEQVLELGDYLSDSNDQRLTHAFITNSGYAPHNAWLTTTLFYGFPTGLVLVLLYWRVVSKNLLRVSSRERVCLSQRGELAVAVGIANLGLIVHSWFHNSGLFLGEMRAWIWIGIGLATAQLFSRV